MKKIWDKLTLEKLVDIMVYIILFTACIACAVGLIKSWITKDSSTSSPVEELIIDSISKTNNKLIIEINNIDSIKNATIIEVKSLDNDSTLRLFYQLIGN